MLLQQTMVINNQKEQDVLDNVETRLDLIRDKMENKICQQTDSHLQEECK